MHFLKWSILVVVLSTGQLFAQVPKITPAVVPGPGEMYTYKFIKQTTAIDTLLKGENVFWDFNKVKDTAIYFEEVYRETLPSQNEVFEDAYSIDSTSVRTELICWVNYLDSSGYYRLGAYEKPEVFESEIPYEYRDTMVLLKFPFVFGEKIKDRYEFIKGDRKHHKNQYVEVEISCDGYGTAILPNGDTCYQAMRIRREEKFYHIVNEAAKPVGVKVIFYWYSAIKQNYFIKATYINGKPFDAWYQKKRSIIKKKKNYN